MPAIKTDDAIKLIKNWWWVIAMVFSFGMTFATLNADLNVAKTRTDQIENKIEKTDGELKSHIKYSDAKVLEFYGVVKAQQVTNEAVSNSLERIEKKLDRTLR